MVGWIQIANAKEVYKNYPGINNYLSLKINPIPNPSPYKGKGDDRRLFSSKSILLACAKGSPLPTVSEDQRMRTV